MTYQELIDHISEYIIANGNNEITGPVLNQVLIPMVQQINELVGALEDLETPVNTSIVDAINSILGLIESSSQIHVGQPNPNVTPPDNYAVADWYSQVNVSNNPIALWVYTGVAWVNVAGEGLPVIELSSLNLFQDGSFENGISSFMITEGSGTLDSVEAALIAPRNAKMLRAVMEADSTIERSLGIPVNYKNIPAQFSCWVYTDEFNIEIDVLGGNDPLTTILVEAKDEWQNIIWSFNVDESAPPTLGVRVRNTDACTYNLDEIYLGGRRFAISDYIPLTGTNPNAPVTGNIQFVNGAYIFIPHSADPSGSNRVFFSNTGVGLMSFDGTYVSSAVQTVGAFTINGNDPSFLGVVGQSDFSANYTPNAYVQNIYVLNNIVTSSAGTLALGYNRPHTQVIGTGTTSTWTLPAVGSSVGKSLKLINYGSGDITLNSNAGGNDISQAGTDLATRTIHPKCGFELICDGTKWIIIGEVNIRLVDHLTAQNVTSTTETDITQFTIPVEVNKIYKIRVAINGGNTGANGTRYGFKFPAGSELMRIGNGNPGGATTIVAGASLFTSNTGLIATNYNAQVSQNGWLIIEATLYTGGTAGNFIVTFGSVNAAQTSSVLKGSSLEIIRKI